MITHKPPCIHFISFKQAATACGASKGYTVSFCCLRSVRQTACSRECSPSLIWPRASATRVRAPVHTSYRGPPTLCSEKVWNVWASVAVRAGLKGRRVKAQCGKAGTGPRTLGVGGRCPQEACVTPSTARHERRVLGSGCARQCAHSCACTSFCYSTGCNQVVQLRVQSCV